MSDGEPSRRSLSILVPLFNEEKTVRPFLDELYAKCLNHMTDYEVLLLEDGSKDRTVEVMRECEKIFPNLKAISAGARVGYAVVVTRGIAQASKDWILLMDGDGQIEPDDLRYFLACSDDYDIICGEKFPRCDPWYRIVVSRWFDICSDIILGVSVRDINFGFKLMRAEAAKKIAPRCGKLGEIYTAELVIRFIYAGYRFHQMRVRHRRRMMGTTSQGIPPRVLLKKSWRAFTGLFKLRGEFMSGEPV